MRGWLRSTFIALTGVLFCGSGASFAAFDIEGLAADVEDIRASERVPAVGVAMLERGSTPYVAAWGRTGNPAAPTLSPSTPLRLGSITKTFTAIAFAELLHARSIDFATPLETIVGPGSHDNPFPQHPVRLRHLVEHTAGFGDLSRAEFDYTNPEPIALADAFALDPASRRSWWPPGTRHSYSNVSPGLIALTIERLSGETFEAFTTRTVLRPLGMSSASFFPVPDLAKGYREDGVTEIPYWQMTFRAYGALNASVAEVSRFLAVLLDSSAASARVAGHGLSQATLGTLRRPVSTLGAEAGLTIGYALGVYGWVSGRQVFWGHGGDADGYRSRFGWLPDAGRAYFVIINADNPRALERLRALIEHTLTKDLAPQPVPAPLPPPPAVSAAGLIRWAGEYYPSSARFGIDDWRARRLPTVRVDVADGALVFRRGHRNVELVPVNSHLFRRKDDPVATAAFIERAVSGGTCVHLQGELGNFVKLDLTRTEAFQNGCVWE